MNEPIISPWIIYIIDVCNSISTTAMFFSVLGVFATIVASIVISSEAEYTIQDKKLWKGLMIFTTVSVIVAIIIPDKRVGYTMLATQYITQENILKAVETADKIANRIIQIKGDNIEDYGNKEKGK